MPEVKIQFNGNDVLAAVQKFPYGLSVMDVAEFVLEDKGINIQTTSYTPRSSALRKHISISALREKLEILVDRGELFFLPTENMGGRGKGSRYYTKERVEKYKKDVAQRVKEHRERQARRQAVEIVAAEHQDAVDQLAGRILAEDPIALQLYQEVVENANVR